MTPLRIGLFGFGVVGQGLYDTLNSSKGIHATIEKICVKHPGKHRRLSEDRFTYDRNDILNDPRINLVLELIDNAEEGFQIVSEAMLRGKAVVSSSKKMIATYFDQLLALQKGSGVPLLYEGSVCGSIPIIRNLEEYYDTELLDSVEGIFNGTTNYILTKMFSDQLGYDVALSQAQALGFAESNPTLDVEGFDAKFKIVIAAAHAFGVFVRPEDVFNYGITTISKDDMKLAREKGLKIRLLVSAQKVEDKVAIYVMPGFVRADNPLYTVENEYNGVSLSGVFSDRQFFLGKGAGSYPTGSAVLSDVSASSYGYKYEYKKHNQSEPLLYTTGYEVEIYLRYASEAVLNLFPFTEIIERHYEPHFKYVVGRIALAELMQVPDLHTLEAFIALVPDSRIRLI